MDTIEKLPDVIRTRRSCRNYMDKAIDEEALGIMEGAMEKLPAAPFGNTPLFRLIRTDRYTEGKKLGTYGVIRGARNFIVGSAGRGENSLEDYGYCFEHLVILATSLSLNTCWLGGTFKRTVFGDALGTGETDVVPAISPLGYGAGRRTLVDRAFRFAAGSDKRKPWQELFFATDFETPLPVEAAGGYNDVLELVRMGPSASNNQPWRIVKDGDRFHFHLQRTPRYQKMWPVDLQRIDMGIAMYHFQASARHFELDGQWSSKMPAATDLPELTSWVATWETTS